MAREGVSLKPRLKWSDRDVESEDTRLVEAVVALNSYFINKSLKELQFRENFGATVLALRHRGRLMRDKLSETKLDAGDALLLEVKSDRYNQLRNNPSFVIISEIEQEVFRKRKLIPALLIVFGVILTATLGIMPIVVSAIVGSILLVLVGCIRMEEAYKAIEWRIVILLAGVLTLGVALEKTGCCDSFVGADRAMGRSVGRQGGDTLGLFSFDFTSYRRYVEQRHCRVAWLRSRSRPRIP